MLIYFLQIFTAHPGWYEYNFYVFFNSHLRSLKELGYLTLWFMENSLSCCKTCLFTYLFCEAQKLLSRVNCPNYESTDEFISKKEKVAQLSGETHWLTSSFTEAKSSCVSHEAMYVKHNILSLSWKMFIHHKEGLWEDLSLCRCSICKMSFGTVVLVGCCPAWTSSWLHNHMVSNPWAILGSARVLQK